MLEAPSSRLVALTTALAVGPIAESTPERARSLVPRPDPKRGAA